MAESGISRVIDAVFVPSVAVSVTTFTAEGYGGEIVAGLVEASGVPATPSLSKSQVKLRAAQLAQTAVAVKVMLELGVGFAGVKVKLRVLPRGHVEYAPVSSKAPSVVRVATGAGFVRAALTNAIGLTPTPTTSKSILNRAPEDETEPPSKTSASLKLPPALSIVFARIRAPVQPVPDWSTPTMLMTVGSKVNEISKPLIAGGGFSVSPALMSRTPPPLWPNRAGPGGGPGLGGTQAQEDTGPPVGPPVFVSQSTNIGVATAKTG